MPDWVNELRQQYQSKIGDPGVFDYPKSHWVGCDRGE